MNIYKNGKKYSEGGFETAVDAAIAYNNMAVKLHGKFAKLNIIPSPSLYEWQ
jgi:hypothetical protein